MSQKFNFATFFGMEEPSQEKQQKRNNVVSMTPKEPLKSKIIVFAPVSYSDTDMIAQKLMDGDAVIVKFDNLDANSSARMVDFLNGTIFAIHGAINRLDKNIFICTPANFQISK
ncbi:cell division protein [Lentilactobacillus curieae]|uniref:Cell division protein SepF n=2 Tax=Lentilactobacillus curieae TaxID=1138822 RepID=A0A1S6QG36_9LACO|nr:cell division protein [Lentilactobacillus curieae]